MVDNVWYSNQLHSSLQLAGAAVEIGSGGADASVPGQRFQNVDGSALVGKVGDPSASLTGQGGHDLQGW